MESIEALVVASAPLEAQNDKKATPLHLAAMHGRLDSIIVLLAAGASVGALDDENATPLHLATVQGHSESIEVLVAARAATALETISNEKDEV